MELADTLGRASLVSSESDAVQRWEAQIDGLRDRVEAWTGNALQVVDLSFDEWRRATPRHRVLLDEVERDGIEVVKARAMLMRPQGDKPRG